MAWIYCTNYYVVIIKAIDCSFYNASAIALRPSFYKETDVKAGVSLLKYQKHLSWTYLLWLR